MTPPSGLVGWWSADGTPSDSAGTNTGTLGGSASFVDGKVNGAFSFDGASGYLSTSLDVQPSAMPSTTWEAWVYPTRIAGRQQIMSCDDGGYDRSVMVDGDSFGIFTGSSVWRPAAVTLNQWYHIAVVFTPDNIVFYTNGVAFSYGAAPSFGGTGNKLQVGRNPGYGEFYQGLVDEVSVYNRALSDSEISAIYLAGTAGKCRATPLSSDLGVAVTASAATVMLSDKLTYSILITNAGPNLATQVVTRVQFSGALVFVSASTSSGIYLQAGSTITFQADSLPVAGSAAMTVVLQPASAGMVTNSFNIYGGQMDLNLANNSASSVVTITNQRIDASNGDWSQESVRLTNTPEADVMLRSGDIDNLNFGWPPGFDPFSGNSTPPHGYPWAVNSADASGTDRIMVGSGYDGHPPKGQDGYTGSTSRPANLPEPIILSNNVPVANVSAAVLQLFVDDFQASLWGASYQVLINGVRAPFLEDQINALVQTGPIGRLITVQVPSSYLSLVSTGDVTLFIDDPVTGAGDGYAVDFAKLLLNPHAFAQTGTINGTVRENLFSQPVANALVSAGGGLVTAVTDAQGNYTLTNVPGGLVFVTATKFGYAPEQQSVNLVAGTTQTLNFQLTVVPELRILGLSNGAAVLRWPAPLSNWILESTPALANGNSAWADLQVGRTFVDGETQALPPATNINAFYRLRKP